MSAMLGTVPDGRVGLTCSVCGDFFTLGYRSNSDRKKNGREPVCMLCKKPALVVVTDPFLDWWKERFSDDEILSMAEESWGPRSGWGPRENWSLMPGVRMKDGVRALEV